MIISRLRHRYKEFFSEMVQSLSCIALERFCSAVLLDLFEKEVEKKMKSIGGKYLTPVADVLHRMAYSTRIVGVDLQDIVKLATQCNTLEELQALLHEPKLRNFSFVVEVFGKHRFQVETIL